jgi:tRNA modification GTPase
VRTLRDDSGDVLDEVLVLRFNGPASATGEDVVELHCHGGRAIVDAILRALGTIEGTREALPGEFTRRSLENGRIDLTEAEGLADLLEAETESQRKSALALAEGGLRRVIEDWQQRLLDLSARAEAAIDYVDEDDFEHDGDLAKECERLAAELRDWLGRPRVEPLKDGVRVVVAGPPNVGKSSLINVIAGQEKAIVTDIPGTTRDHIEVPLSVGGMPILLTDTAGLRESEEIVERIGIQRTRQLVEGADILLWLGEPDSAPDHDRLIRVHSRSDLPDRHHRPPGSMAVSSVTGAGMKALLDRVGELAADLLPWEGAVALNRRQAAHLEEAELALQRAACAGDAIVFAEEARLARAAFDRLTGRAGIEDVLDALFGRFCLGK